MDLPPHNIDHVFVGLFGKSVIDEAVIRKSQVVGPVDAAGVGSSDLILFSVVALVITVGSFATQVAASTWQEIKEEMNLLRTAQSGENIDEEVEEMGVMEMLAIKEGDLPAPIERVIAEMKGAWSRLRQVLLDEVTSSST